MIKVELSKRQFMKCRACEISQINIHQVCIGSDNSYESTHICGACLLNLKNEIDMAIMAWSCKIR